MKTSKMPSKRKQSPTSSNKNSDQEGGGIEDYRKKRDRNNQAVKRSRVKSKQKTQETQHKVNELKVKNTILEEKITTLQKDLKFLKDLFLTQAQAKSDKISKDYIQKLLEDDSDEDAT